MADLCRGEDKDERRDLMTTGSFRRDREKETGGRSMRGKGSNRRIFDVDDCINFLHGSDPVRVELSRLQNQLRDKDRELGDANVEIKALRLSERAREKAVEELTEKLTKLEGKLKLTESLLDSKNLEVKKINDDKKASMAAQFAAEAALRRVHTEQKDDYMPPVEAILAPLEAELKLACQNNAKLQDSNRALERLTKSKEIALLEAEKTIEIALAKASMVDDLQNNNQSLMKQIEICQEENKILDKLQRQKIAEVEKLSQTVKELEESVLAGAGAANAVRDYQRKFQEMNTERKTLDRELARAKVTANRLAGVAANEWKDTNDKVMPVKQWLEERRFMQGELQQLRDKLTVAERSARSESQLKEKITLRLKVIEDRLRMNSSANSRVNDDGRILSIGPSRRQSFDRADNLSKVSPKGIFSKSSLSSHLKSSLSFDTCTVLKEEKGASRSFEIGSRFVDRGKLSNHPSKKVSNTTSEFTAEIRESWKDNSEEKSTTTIPSANSEDMVSGMLYDMLQKEVISLRKACQEKNQSLNDKDDAIEILTKKISTLTKAMEVDAKKMRREVSSLEKELAAMRVEKEHEKKTKRFGAAKASTSSSQLLPGRTLRPSRVIRTDQTSAMKVG